MFANSIMHIMHVFLISWYFHMSVTKTIDSIFSSSCYYFFSALPCYFNLMLHTKTILSHLQTSQNHDLDKKTSRHYLRPTRLQGPRSTYKTMGFKKYEIQICRSTHQYWWDNNWWKWKYSFLHIWPYSIFLD